VQQRLLSLREALARLSQAAAVVHLLSGPSWTSGALVARRKRVLAVEPLLRRLALGPSADLSLCASAAANALPAHFIPPAALGLLPGKLNSLAGGHSVQSAAIVYDGKLVCATKAFYSATNREAHILLLSLLAALPPAQSRDLPLFFDPASAPQRVVTVALCPPTELPAPLGASVDAVFVLTPETPDRNLLDAARGLLLASELPPARLMAVLRSTPQHLAPHISATIVAVPGKVSWAWSRDATHPQLDWTVFTPVDSPDAISVSPGELALRGVASGWLRGASLPHASRAVDVTASTVVQCISSGSLVVMVASDAVAGLPACEESLHLLLKAAHFFVDV
jgi:hypothetical protein